MCSILVGAGGVVSVTEPRDWLAALARFLRGEPDRMESEYRRAEKQRAEESAGKDSQRQGRQGEEMAAVEPGRP